MLVAECPQRLTKILSISFQYSQETALMVAARKGSVEIIRKLIHNGANVNLTNKVTMETNFIVIIMGD